MQSNLSPLRIGINLFLVLILSLPTLYGQSNIPNRAKNKAKRKVDRKIDNAIDDGIDDAFDAIGNVFKKKNKKKKKSTNPTPTPSNEPQTESDPSVTINTDEDTRITIEEDVDAASGPVEKSDFIGSFTMETHEYKKGKLSKDHPISISFHLDAYRTAIEMPAEKKSQTILVYDRQARKMTMKMIEDGEKTATISKMPSYKVTIEEDSYEEGRYSVTPTGRTKTIMGYEAAEFMIETDEEVSHVWIARELEANFGPSMNMGMANVKVFNKNGQKFNYSERYNLRGMWLEVHTKSKTEDVTRDMFLKDLVVGSVNDQLFSTDGYEVTDVSNINLFGN